MTGGPPGRSPRPGRAALAGRVLAFAAAVVSFLAAPRIAVGQEKQLQNPRRAGADTIPGQIERLEAMPDSLLSDSLRFVRDSLIAARDSLARKNLEAAREGLSGGDFPDKDEFFEQLSAEKGRYEVVEYRGEIVRLGIPKRHLRLEGEAQLNRAGDVLTADTIGYRGEEQFIEAHRDIQLLGADGSKAVSDSLLYYDVGRLRGTLFDAESQFQEGGTEWRVFGNVIPLAQDTIYATHARFTSCDLETPHYTFRASQLKMVTNDVLVAWPVVLYVGRVPIFWLPFFAADIRQGRRSGIIPPRFGVNDIVQTSGQTSRNISDFGYYWAISDYLDAQATVDWFSGSYTRLNGAFRYRWLKEFIRGSVIYSQSFGEDGDNLQLRVGHDQELGLNTTFRASVNYVQDTRIYQDQSVNPYDQTRTIDSDVGFNHRFSFGNLQLSADRQEYLDGSQTTTTLPRLNFSVSPVTLFAAPASRAGAFNNITLDGSTRFSRQVVTADSSIDRTTTIGGGSGTVRVGEFSISSNAQLTDLKTTPVDSTFQDLPTETQSTLQWSSNASFRIGLVGSTTLNPTASLSGARFRSDDTGGEFVSAPTRASFGARLTTDVYGFYPGFGPFTRLRHKISPGIDYAYSPEVAVDSALAAIPGFPTTAGDARNQLSFSLNQTFEAKLPSREQPRDTVVADTLVGGPLPIADSTRSRAFPEMSGLSGEPRRPERDRIVTLLGIRTSALRFDFARARQGEPVLVSDQITNNFTSDLLRGLSINMTHDLFEGTGADRKFDLFLTALTASFSLSSGQGLADIFGLGGGSGPPLPAATSSLDRYRDPSIYGASDPFSGGAGPWSASVTYSLQRPRPTESGVDSQSLNGTLSLRPTPHWSIRWTTQYNLTDSEFGQNVITLDRDLHRWMASFQFARSPNGNTVFQVSVSLKDQPDVRGNFNQRTN